MPLQIDHIDPATLLPAPYNPRSISDEAFRRLKRGIEHFGLVDPIIARRADRLVVGGHQRLRAALELGLGLVPVVLLDDLDDTQAAALNVLLNNPTTQGAWDMGRLSTLLNEINLPTFDLALTGFSTQELSSFLRTITDTPTSPTPTSRVVNEQFLVAVQCVDETQMHQLFEEFTARGLSCKLVM